MGLGFEWERQPRRREQRRKDHPYPRIDWATNWSDIVAGTAHGGSQVGRHSAHTHAYTRHVHWGLAPLAVVLLVMTTILL